MNLEKGQTVYDSEGYLYSYLGKLGKGHLVSEIFSGRLPSGKKENVLGKVVYLDVVYTERPTRERLKEVEDLEERKRTLELDILTREAELTRLKNVSVEDILKERLRRVKGAEFLIKALTKTFKMYSYSSVNGSVYSLNYGAVGVDLATQEVYLLRQDDMDGEHYSREKLLQPPTFLTREEAEEALLKEVLKGNVEVYNYSRGLEIDSLFDKYKYQRTRAWKETLEKCKREKIRGIEEEIELAEKGVERYKKTLKDAEDRLRKLKDSF